MTFFCVKTQLSVTKVHFLFDSSKFRLHLLNEFKGFRIAAKEKEQKQTVTLLTLLHPACFLAPY